MNLETAKEGDYIKTSGYGREYRLHKVTKTTKTQVVCGNTRFNKESGRRIGAQKWDASMYGYLATEKDLLTARGDKAKRDIKAALEKMSPELALQIAALIEAYD